MMFYLRANKRVVVWENTKGSVDNYFSRKAGER